MKITLAYPPVTKISGNIRSLKPFLYEWAKQFPFAACYDNCESHIDRYGTYEFLMGVAGPTAEQITDLGQLTSFAASRQDWLMGIFPYDLKNRVEPKLSTRHTPGIEFPEVAFFVPETMIMARKDSDVIEISGDPRPVLQALELPLQAASIRPLKMPAFVSNFSRESYMDTITRIREHIRDGDFYEMNLSQAFTADYQLDDPVNLFQKLISISPVPFAAYVRFDHRHLLCASPERFLQLKDQRLLSQPIKGTAARGKTEEEDHKLKNALRSSLKEQAENVMIVDLTRNDLYRSSKAHTVKAPHLFEIQTFPKVHQMVSTVTGMKAEALNWLQAFLPAFPPGSMTGAPKFRVMEMTDQYEPAARGVYAGSAGYISPEKEFDFNVIIRSLIYDAQRNRLSYQTGGAITWGSDPEKEYEETLIKAQAIRELFEAGS